MIIAPSLLASDHTRFGSEAERAGRSGAEWLHLDIMDEHFVRTGSGAGDPAVDEVVF